MKSWLIIAGISVALFYGSICALFYLTQRQLVFAPPGKMRSSPTGYYLEEVTFTTRDGFRLNGRFLNNSGDKTVLFCHGNGANISNLGPFIEICRELGVDALFFDYRGYGKSKGSISSEEDLYRDAASAYRYLIEEKEFKPSQIVVWGKSIGGAAALEISRGKDLHAVILQSTFTSLTERIQEMVPIIPVKPLLNFHYDNREKLDSINSPILIIHSTDDRLIPLSHGKALYRAADEPKSFITLTGPHSRMHDKCFSKLLRGVKYFINEPVEGISRWRQESGLC